MADVTVKQFATVVGIPAERLLMQFEEAGIKVAGAEAMITDQQKRELLAHLRKAHGKQELAAVSGPKKITLRRKTHSEIKMAGGAAGQVKTVSVEVRRKRTYVKRSVVLEDEGKGVQETGLMEKQGVLEEADEARRRIEEEASRQTARNPIRRRLGLG